MSAVMPLPPASVPSCARAVRAAGGRWLALVLIVLALCLFVLGTAVGSMGFENLWPALWNPQGATAPRTPWRNRLCGTSACRAPWVPGLQGRCWAWGRWRKGCSATRWPTRTCWAAPRASLGVALALAPDGGAGGMLGGAQGALTVSVYSSHWLVRLGLTGAAFVGAVLAVLLTLALARGVQHTLRLLLAVWWWAWCWGAHPAASWLSPIRCRPCRRSCWAPPALSAGRRAC